MPRAAPCPQLTAVRVAADYGFTPRYWRKLAADGRVPGVRQPSGPGGQWLFDRKVFSRWAKSVGYNRNEELPRAEPKDHRLHKPPRKETPTDQVYFIYSAGRVKIGISSNITKRKHSFTTASPVPIRLLCCFPASFANERAIQEQFISCHQNGEWFRLTPELREFILAKQAEHPNDGYTLESAEAEYQRWLAT